MSRDLRLPPSEGARICVDLGTALTKATAFLGDSDAVQSEIAPLPIGAASGSEHPLLTPSAMFVDEDRIFFGPAAIERARLALKTKRNPILSFKLVLSAPDLAATLAFKLSRSIDPTGTLRQCDALVLYFAYIDQLIRAAIANEADLSPALANAPRRITSPLWRRDSDAVRKIGMLFSQSIAVSEKLGAQMMNADGVRLDAVREALDYAAKAPRSNLFEGIVLEAHAAVSAYATLVSVPARYVLVVDMGAGTTDIAGFELQGASHQAVMTEIHGTQQCCVLAGDELDNIVVDRFVRSRGKLRIDVEARLWRALRLSAAELKQSLFSRGKAVFKHDDQRMTLSQEAVTKDSAFKAYCNALSKTLSGSLALLAAKAKEDGAKSVTILLAGGGSHLPFLADLVKTAAASHTRGLKLEIEPFGARWALPHRHHPLGGVLPQLAIAMGGAVAAVEQESSLATEAA